MHLRLHGSGSLRGIQIDWGADVERSPELRAAMAGHDIDRMQIGTVRRGYLARAVLYPRGAIALRVAEGHEIFLQVPDEAVAAGRSAPVAIAATVATVEQAADGDHHRVVVGDRDQGERVDLIVPAAVPSLSRSLIRRLIDDGRVRVGGQPVDKANRRLRAGDVVELVVTAAAAAAADEPTPEPP